MFKYKNQIDNVLRYFCEKGELYLSKEIDEGRGLVEKINLANNLLINKIELDKYILHFIFDDNNLLLIDGSNNGLFFNDCLVEIARVPSPLKVSESDILSNFLVVFQGKIKEREFGIYSKNKNEILWLDKEQKSLESIGDYLFGQNSFEIHRSEINTGKILWKSDLKSIYPALADKSGRINFLNVYDDLLIVGIDAIDKLLAIDINNGSLKWELETIPKFELLDTNNGKIHSLTDAYFCVDAKSGKQIDSFQERSYFEKIGLISQRGNYAIAGDHLFTTDHAKGIIGAFNTVTHKFDWVHKEEGVNFPGANPIIYSEPYLFVNDNKRTLHIFEKI